ncbi:hypothetical protein BHM03_00006430 [Ensete ventricosum]|nr:hypothetical protein BHM03_00006430 [Ensete ventricosum]
MKKGSAPIPDSRLTTPDSLVPVSLLLEKLGMGDKKILVMREIPEIKVKNLLSNKESLAACDIAVFVHDRLDAAVIWVKMSASHKVDMAHADSFLARFAIPVRTSVLRFGRYGSVTVDFDRYRVCSSYCPVQGGPRTGEHPCLFCSSDEESWKRTKELLVQVASHGENTGFEVPCLIISAKDDLDPYPLAVQDSTRVLSRYFLSIDTALYYSI